MAIYIKIDDIPGSTTEAKYKDQIEADSLSTGVSRSVTQSTGNTSEKMGDKPMFQEVHFTKRADKASSKLWFAVASGQHIKKVVIATVVTNAGASEEVEKLELEDVVVSSFSTSSSAADMPHESISLNFAKLSFTHVPRNAQGKLDAKITTGWDLKTNKKV